MANPQKEKGYTSIANEIIEALGRLRIAGEYHQILFVIFRKTYGFNKKEDAISLSQFVLFTGGMKKASICRAIKCLKEMNIISVKANGIANIYSIQKDFDHWKPLAKKLIVSENANLALAKKLPTKETITKERNTPTKNMKKNSFKYSDKNHSDSFDDEIDYDSQESIEEKKSTVSKSMKDLIAWSINRRGFPFVNVIKQYSAFKKARSGGIDPLRLRERWLEMEGEDFWKEKGFDWTNVVNSFDRKQ